VETPSDTRGTEAVYNRYEVMRRFEHDLSAFGELVELFASCYPEDLSSLRSAIDGGEFGQVSKVSKRLKDAARSFSSEPVLEAVQALEEAALRGSSANESTELLSRLEKNLDILQAALDEALGHDR